MCDMRDIESPLVVSQNTHAKLGVILYDKLENGWGLIDYEKIRT